MGGSVISPTRAGFGPFRAVGKLTGCVKVELGECAPCLPRFILLGSFSDTLLVVSILDIIAICRRFCSPEGVKSADSCIN